MSLIDREKRKKRRTETDEAIHIVALWNLMLILIPFLLLSSAFSETTVLSIQIPAGSPSASIHSSAASGAAPKEPVRLMVNSGGFRLEQGPAKSFDIPLRTGAYDYAGLRAALNGMKTANPDEENITLSAAPGVPYETVVKTMDECRLARFSGISIGENQDGAFR